MAATVRWGFDPSIVITSFQLDKSTDAGLNYLPLSTVTFNLGGANFDRDTNTFFVADGAGNPGDIYRITSIGANGTSKNQFAISPPDAAATCTIIGYIKDAFDRSDVTIKVFVENYGTPGEKWVKNPTGLVANHNEALGILKATDVVFPNSDGIWQVAAIRETYARIRIPELDFDWAFQVPNEEGPKNIRDIKQLRGASFGGIFPEQGGVREAITTG